MDSTIGLPPGAFEEASVEISTGKLGVSVSLANTNTYATRVMANILDLHVPHSIPSQSNTMSEIQNVSTTPQNPNEVKDQPLPTLYFHPTFKNSTFRSPRPKFCFTAL
jgi:hypothetical protein